MGSRAALPSVFQQVEDLAASLDPRREAPVVRFGPDFEARVRQAGVQAPTGEVVVIAPNANHGRRRLAALLAHPDPTPAITLSQLVADLAAAGLVPHACHAARADVLVPGDHRTQALPDAVIEWLRGQPGALDAVFVLRARPGEPTGQLPQVHSAYRYADVVPLDRAARVAEFEARHAALTTRDYLIGCEAQLDRLRAEAGAAQTEAAEAQQRARALELAVADLESELDAVRASTTWRAGRALVAPVAALRRKPIP